MTGVPGAAPLLAVEDLSVSYGATLAVDRVSFSLERGGSLGLAGESGCGKSSIALSLLGLLRGKASLGGRVAFDGAVLEEMDDAALDAFRWRRAAIVFQNSLEVLNPLLSVGAQIVEAMERHGVASGAAARARAEALLVEVGLDAVWFDSPPHRLSGGMRQKVLIAMALSCDPELLILDEPTMALDAVSKTRVVSLLERLRADRGVALLIISHELDVIRRLSDRVLVMYGGRIMEEGSTAEVLSYPLHPYSRGLAYSSTAVNPFRDLWGIPGEAGGAPDVGCPFAPRCAQRLPECFRTRPVLEETRRGRRVSCLRGGIVPLLQAKGIRKTFPLKDRRVVACGGCDLVVRFGEAAALIGESGSGKTTLSEILAGLSRADEGTVHFEGRAASLNAETARRGGLQMAFQDPLSSVDGNLTVLQAVREPLDILRDAGRRERDAQAATALEKVRLPVSRDFLSRRCFALSGGQRQRVALARSLVMEPKLLIADEISAMLDPSTGANVLRLLKGLQNEEGFAMLYVTHDLALARKIADVVYVMKDGLIVESGPADRVFSAPRQEYTRTLLECAVFSEFTRQSDSSSLPHSRAENSRR